MAYAWSRYIFVHCFQTRTDIWELLSFVEGGRKTGETAWKPWQKGRERTTSALTCAESALLSYQCVEDCVRTARNLTQLEASRFSHISFLALKMNGNWSLSLGKTSSLVILFYYLVNVFVFPQPEWVWIYRFK